MSCGVKMSGGAAAAAAAAGTPWVPMVQVAAGAAGLSPSSSCPSLGAAQQQQQKPASPARSVSGASRSSQAAATKRGEDALKLIRYVDDNLVGKNATFLGPFGRRKVVYCDYTATGRSLQFLEDYIVKEVLPYLGDTRASTSICSLQSSLFRHEAREMVRHAVGAADEDAVLFTGQSTAGALRTLLRHLELGAPGQQTVVFVGPFEHHANLRPWREYGVKLVRIDETREGFLDLNDLERKLISLRSEQPHARPVGYFSAASCITGVIADDVATTLLLRQYGALSVWDYTSAAAYVKMEMNPKLAGVAETTVPKDAIIFAGHKLIGGAQSPGVLVAKRSLLGEDLGPEDMRDSHRHLRDPELREESATAGVVEAIRCGLAVQLRENITPQAIAARHDKISKQVLAHVRTIPELILLGCSSHSVKRLPTFSFMVRHPRGTFLHHNFVCAVLNDVFGVQARAGCACAGSYAHGLMGIDRELARRYEALLLAGPEQENESSFAETLRPGFVRLSFPYFMGEAEVGFVLEALKMVATEGWKLLPQYVLDGETGEWRHHTNSVFKERRWLGAIRYTDGRMSASERRVSGPGIFPQSHSDCLHTARNIFNRARKMAQRFPKQIDTSVRFDGPASEALRWFMLAHEAQDLLLGHSHAVKHHVPFDPAPHCSRPQLAQPAADASPSSPAGGIRRLNSDVVQRSPGLGVSPRHRSLPALSCPLELRRRANSTRTSEPDEDDERTGSPRPRISFALGEPVTTGPVVLGTSPSGPSTTAREQHQQLKPDSAAGPLASRTRCNSLGSSSTCRARLDSGCSAGSASSPVPIPLSPQTLASLGIAGANTGQARHRHCSCSSQTELLSSLDSSSSPVARSASSLGHVSATSPAGSCSSSFDSVMNASRLGRSSPLLSMSHSSEDDLRAYLKEVTKELATEIKSEIREVISKVDDALSETSLSDHHRQALDNKQQQHKVQQQLQQQQQQQQQQQHDSFSASDIAEYLMEFSKEMASEVKSEIRCMVSSVDGLHRYSPEENKSSSGCASPLERRRRLQQQQQLPRSPLPAANPVEQQQQQQQQHDSKVSSECSSDETVILVAAGKKRPSVGQRKPSHNSDEEEDEEEEEEDEDGEEDEVEKALPKIYSAVNSVSSQDSGINLSFGESDGPPAVLASCARGSRGQLQPRGGGRKPSLLLSEDEETYSSADTSAEEQLGWQCPPSSVWEPSLEALQEFGMVRPGDRVLVCLAPHGLSSLGLLHTLHQYRAYAGARGVAFELGVASLVGPGCEAGPLCAYLDSLGLSRFVERHEGPPPPPPPPPPPLGPSEPPTSFCDRAARAALYALARRHRYNVLALGQNLDDLGEGFFSSLLGAGRLSAMKAHYAIREQGLRVVRPLVYVRAKALQHFAHLKGLPLFARPPAFSPAPQKKREELASRQEAYPRLYWSLRSALRPLISAEQPGPKRQQPRRPRANSFGASSISSSSSYSSSSSVSSTSSCTPQQRLDDSSEQTDEEPVA